MFTTPSQKRDINFENHGQQFANENFFLLGGLFYLATVSNQNLLAQGPDTSTCQLRVKLKFPLTQTGSVQYRNASEIEGSNWMLGCETLDRDFTDYDQYKEYLNPLGIKLLRMQAG